MTTTVENFRSALNGFNRADVVQFIQSQTMQHEKEISMLKEENARLQEALSAARTEAEEAKLAKEALELLAAKPKESTAAPSRDERRAPADPQPDFNELELAAYRRAELTERLARERAAASAGQMKTIFAQATERLNLSSQDLATLLDAFREDFEKLNQLLTDTRGIVNESSSSLRAATEVCGEL